MTAAEAAWSVRPARPDDVPEVLELFRATFGKPLSQAAYRWKYVEAPAVSTAATSFVAVAGGRVVGHLGGTPLRIRVGGTELSAHHAADGMVAADFRQQGIMTAIGRAASEAWADGGASLVLAVPTQNWVGLNDRLDYRFAFRLGWLWRPLWRALEPRAPRGVRIEAVETAGSELDALWKSVNGDFDALVVRSRRWLEYRYGAASGRDYRILVASTEGRPAGYVVYRLVGDSRRSSWIVDLFGSRSASSMLLRAAFRELRRAGAADTRIFAARGTSLWRDAIRTGFAPRRGTYDVRVGPLADDLPWDVLRDPRRFFVAGGDFDVV